MDKIETLKGLNESYTKNIMSTEIEKRQVGGQLDE